MNYADHYGYLITDPLEAVTPLPSWLKTRLNRAVVGLLDSPLIIEEACASFERKPVEAASTLQAEERFVAAMNSVAAGVEADGLAPHYMTMMREFAKTLFTLFSSDAQMDKVKQWVADGSSSCFLMTDTGGPSPAHWNSRVALNDGKQLLTVDKCWAMGGDGPLFAIVAAAMPSGLYPAAFLLAPEQCGALVRSNAGPSMLDGVIQLQNFKGQVEVFNSDKLTKGGPTMLNRLLTLVRPQFVRCLMGHLKWLAGQGRVRLDAESRAALECIQAIAAHLAAQPYSNAMVTQVLAAKFASNELLNELVAASAVASSADQRDLLAFTKMEGSSYRCLREIYAKAYAYNRPAPVKAAARVPAKAAA